MKCLNCGKEISETAKFCRFCGKKSETIYCRNCGAVLEADSLFCSECGASVGKTGSGGDDIPFGGFRWEEDRDGTIFITGHCGNSGKVNIPPVINGKRVTEICSGAFYGNTVITDIVIPNSVKRIGERAFYRCTSLRSVILPEGITEIGREMFCECNLLKDVNIPDGVRIIEQSAFYLCDSLGEITIPDSVTGLGRGAFLGCGSPGIKYKGRTYIPDHMRYYDGFQELYDDINSGRLS